MRTSVLNILSASVPYGLEPRKLPGRLIDACARVLREAGAGTVVGVTFGRTV